jgi:peptidoglycan/xylan/chitin deacetylase (PgdA/CDA1 family)
MNINNEVYKKIIFQKKMQKNKLLSSRSWSLLYIAIVLFVFLIGVGAFIVFNQFKPTGIELPKHEVRTIPSGLHSLLTSSASISANLRVPILMYHYVEYVQDKGDKMRQALNVNPNVFDAQLKTLTDAGYTFMTASELQSVIDGYEQLPPKPILITIDDGHWDLYTDILPILEKYHVRATAYIISGFLGGSDFLTSEQLQKVVQSGMVEIGAHTVHHVALAGKLSPVVTYEVKQSKEDLEKNYHIKITSFAYPTGSFDQQAIDAVKAAGFSNAMSTIPGIIHNHTDEFYLYRLRPGYRTGEELLDWLQQKDFKPW